MYDWLKLIHVLAVITWVGGVILINLYAPGIMRGGDVAARLSFIRFTEFAGRVFMISGIVALAAGIWMVLDAEFIEFSQAWISLGFLGIAVGAVLGPTFYTPTSRKLAAAYEADDTAGSTKLGQRIALVSMFEMVLLVVVVWAMIFKPGL